MPVTDDQIATLRALLTRDYEDYERGLDRISSAGTNEAYTALVAAGFTLAAYRRFKDASVADIIAYVSEVRARSRELGELIDPGVAEGLLRGALGDGSADKLSDRAVIEGQTILLPILVGDGQLDDAALDRFLVDVRETADRWLGGS